MIVELLIGLLLLWIVSSFLLFFESTLVVVVIMLISLVFLLRMTLIITGLLKGPVLRTFEKYGDEERSPHLLPQFFFWLGTFTAIGSVWFSSLVAFPFPGELLGGIFLGIAYVAYKFSGFMKEHPSEIYTYPRWYYDIHSRTTRLERRRIAYMWLRLPLRTRLVYNSNDRAFLHWADMIIMSTMQ